MTDQGTRAGYHPAMKALHWVMVVALAVQFLVGYALERADDLLEWLVDGPLGGDEGVLVAVHVGLGLLVLALASVRLLVRWTVGLPPWAPGLSERERRVVHHLERLLYVLLFLIPLSGLALVLLTGEDWDAGAWQVRAPLEWVDDDVLLGVHIAGHLAFLAALAVHLGVVLKHQFMHRDGLLRRML